ncbi:hypothetical protein LTR56_025180 [Elasticomyces elasticus]|nr:hypothetical protein LTR56_025180 [Elasticomyces elasticus]KAK3621063.1 hypothetical protein LTR22_025348 [Elasticomyces elasticus]KAK4904535.1 hypothetical protein LTR49_026034 [Elasticomyces elasticus]KAK5740841.1 hypothetical protein LTS12_024816 [Elasticomyces elasticus]
MRPTVVLVSILCGFATAQNLMPDSITSQDGSVCADPSFEDCYALYVQLRQTNATLLDIHEDPNTQIRFGAKDFKSVDTSGNCGLAIY